MTHAAAIPSLFELRPAKAEKRDLANDQKGAVMLTGLFMAFFLIGALWFVIGVGDAIIFRDRMQEAADHAAFTSAALQAKGMNFISAVNIIMLLMVIVHIVLGIIHDLLLAICITTGVGCVVYVPAMRAYHGYAQIMKPILTGLAWAEKIAAWGYPWLGTIKAYQTGSNYGNQGRIRDVNVVAMGAQNIPGLVGTGLPVEAEPFGYLCEKVGRLVFEFGKRVARGMVPTWLEWVIDPPGPFGGNKWGAIWDLFEGLVGGLVRFRYCNDMNPATSMRMLTNVTRQLTRGRDRIDRENQDIRGRNRDNRRNPDGTPRQPEPEIQNFEINRTSRMTSMGGWSALIDPGFDPGWGNDGPQIPADENGGDGHQVWAINFNPKYRETNEKKVTLAKGVTESRGGLAGREYDEGGMAYFAQAEFYFDCEDTWETDGCNGGFNDNNAAFAIKWRARLRHVELPNLGGILANFGIGQLQSTGIYEQIRGALGGDVGFLNNLARGPLSAIGVNALQGWLDQQLTQLEDRVTDAVTGALGTPTAIPTMAH